MLIMLYGQVVLKKDSRDTASESPAKVHLVSEIKDTEYSNLENMEQVLEVLKTKDLTETQKKELYELAKIVEVEYQFNDFDQVNLVEMQDEDHFDVAELELIDLSQESFQELNNGRDVELTSMDLEFIKQAQRELELDDKDIRLKR